MMAWAERFSAGKNFLLRNRDVIIKKKLLLSSLVSEDFYLFGELWRGASGLGTQRSLGVGGLQLGVVATLLFGQVMVGSKRTASGL